MITNFNIFENYKKRPTTNSKSQLINNADNFWKWFDDSKVTDEQGRPKVVYHGTGEINDYDIFNANRFKKRSGGFYPTFTQYGVFFTDSIITANEYSTNFERPTEESERKQKELNDLWDEMINLKDSEGKINNEKWEEYKRLSKEWPSKNWGDDFYKGPVYSVYLLIKNPLIIDGMGQNWYKVLPDVFNNKLNQSHYDGVIIKNIIEINNDIQTTYIVFSSNQIKSSMSNNGDYDVNSDSILERLQILSS